MYVNDCQKITIPAFKGLYSRGMEDEVPIDHASIASNINFSEKGELANRLGITLSMALGHPVVRTFLATFNDNTVILLTCDGAGHIYQGTNGTPILTVANMVDFTALNMFNKCFINPIVSVYSATNYVQVWDGVTATTRAAAGPAPVASAMTAVDGAADVVGLDPGVHRFAVAYVTNTSFTTKPGPLVSTALAYTSYTAPGLKKINIANIPIGPAYVTQRILLATKSNETQYFFLPGGIINDNVTTSLAAIQFADADLTVDASYLFNLLETIPAGTVTSGMAKYHGRMLAWGTPVEPDLIRVSRPGAPEAMDNVVGYIQLPSERDGNLVRGSFQLRDILYFTKGVGILAAQDNNLDPSSWPIVVIDGGCGSYFYGCSTITASQSTLTANDLEFLADMDGLFVFDGVVRRPSLTWKIDAIWRTINFNAAQWITVYIDPFDELIFVLVPTGSNTTPDTLLVGDFSEGISHDQIKWSNWTFPFVPKSIAMANFVDASATGGYYLRIGQTGNNLYKYDKVSTNDFGTVIDARYKPGPVSPANGEVNVYRGLRFRATGSGSLLLSVSGEDGSVPATPNSLALSASPGKELFRELNLVNEKISVQFRVGTINHQFTVQRLDVFYKILFPQRPG